jgi:hypothetical protein
MPRAQGQTSSQSEPLERATRLPGLLPGYIWLCSHTPDVSKYAHFKYCSGLLRLAGSVFPPVCLLPVRLEWLEANKSPLYQRYTPGPPNYTLLSSSHHPAGLPSRAPAGALFPSVVPPFVVWRESPLSYHVPERYKQPLPMHELQ